MNVNESFYYDIAFFDTIDMGTWIAKASHLIKKVEAAAGKNKKERKKYFVYEKTYVEFK